MRNDGFMSGMLAGVALGAIVVLALSPQMRRPVMNMSEEMGDRMRKMWGHRGDMMDAMMDRMMPGNAQ